MITTKPLASAMMVPTRQVTLPTSAGRSVRFASGIATIHDTNDLPYLMARDDVKLMITEYAMSWMPDVLSKTPKINADVHWPGEWGVIQTGGAWALVMPDPDPAPEPSPEEGEDDEEEEPAEPAPEPAGLDAALKGKPRWRKPPAS